MGTGFIHHTQVAVGGSGEPSSHSRSLTQTRVGVRSCGEPSYLVYERPNKGCGIPRYLSLTTGLVQKVCLWWASEWWDNNLREE